jgi:hypothetical protein
VSDNAIGQHGIGGVDKSKNISTFRLVDEVCFLAVPDTLVVNIFHEATELHAYFDFIPAGFNFYTVAAGYNQFSFS